MNNHTEFRDCLSDIFSGADNEQLALEVLEHCLRQDLDLNEDIIRDIVAKCREAYVDPVNFDPIVEDLMDAIESFEETGDCSKLVDAFSKYSERRPKPEKWL